MQEASPEAILHAKSLSARYRGSRLVLKEQELESILVRLRSGRMQRLEDWRLRAPAQERRAKA